MAGENIDSQMLIQRGFWIFSFQFNNSKLISITKNLSKIEIQNSRFDKRICDIMIKYY